MNPVVFFPLIVEIITAVRDGRREDAAKAAESLAQLARITEEKQDALDAAIGAALKRGGHGDA